MKKKKWIPSWLLISAVWFAMHSGGGFASGQQEVRFYVLFGWTCVIFPFVAEIIQGCVNFFVWDFCRVSKSYDFRTWVDRFYYPYDKLFANLIDAIFVVFLCLPIGLSIAGGANVLQEYCNLPYWLGTVIVAALVFFCSIFGSELIRRLAGIKTVALLGFLGVVIAYGMYSEWPVIAEYFQVRMTSDDFAKNAAVLANPELYSGLPKFDLWVAAKMALLYAAFQSSIAPLISVAEPFENRTQVVKATVVGVLLNGIALACVCMMLFGYMPAVISNEVPIPVLYVVNMLNVPVLKVCYSIALFLAFISTSFTFVFASVRRFENAEFWHKICPKEKQPSLKMRSMVVAILTICYGLAVSQLGMITIVSKGYAYMGWGNLILIVIPVLLFGAIKVKAYSSGKEHRLIRPN